MELGDFSYLGVSRVAHCGASTVAHFARKVRGTYLWRIFKANFIDVQLSPHFHLRAPHFASKVSYSASPQRATMLRILPTEKGYPKTSTAMEILGYPEASI